MIAVLSGVAFVRLYAFRADFYATTEIESATLAELYPVTSDRATTTEIDGALRIPLLSGSHDYVATPKGCSIVEPAEDAVRFNLFFGEASSSGNQELSVDQFQVNSVNLPAVLAGPR